MNWMAMLPLVMMLASTSDLWIHVQSGVSVFVDGQPVGQSTADEGGKMVKGLAPGTHAVVLRTATGGETKMSVDLADGETKEVTISALALSRRSAASTTGTIVVPISAPACAVLVDDKQLENGSGEARAENVSPGSHTVSVRCGTRTAQGAIEVVAGSIANVAADFTTHRLTAKQEARKPLALTVVSTNEKIIRDVQMPEEWKQALIAVSVPGCMIQRLSPLMQVPGVGVWYRCAGTAPYRLVEALEAQPMVVKAGVVDTRTLKTGEIDIYLVMQLRYRQ